MDEEIIHVQTIKMNFHNVIGFLNVSNILMEGRSYRLKLICANKAGYQKQAITQFMIDSSVPVYNGLFSSLKVVQK